MKYAKKNSTAKKDINRLLPMLIALCLIPFVILTKDYQTEFSEFVWFNMTEIAQIDSFEHAKSICVVVMGVSAAIVILISEWLNYKQKKRLFENCDVKILVLCAVYFIMVIISAVCSSYPNLAFTGGGYGQWQTMWVLLANVLLFLYAYRFVDSENQVSVVIKCLMVTVGLLALIGVMQTTGHNPLSWDWVQKIITSKSDVNGITFKEGISNVIITFSNPNYVGPFVALVIPIVAAFVAIRASKENGRAMACRIAGIAIIIGLIISLFGSSSSAGAIAVMTGAAAAVILILVNALTKEAGEREREEGSGKRRKTGMIIGAAVAFVLVAGIGVSRTAFFKNTVNKVLQGSEDTRNIASIVNSDKGLEVTLRNGEEFVLTPTYAEGQNVSFQAYDADQKEIPVEWSAQNSRFVLKDERFQMVTLGVANFNVDNQVYPGFRFYDTPNQIEWIFMYKDNDWQYYTPFGKFTKLHEVESFGFKDYQNIANRRGFIWSRTIPLMKTYWFKGIGPNAFIIAFPNDDFVGSKRVGGNTTLVDKPHNAFLQIYIQTGGISAIAYAGLWILYICGSVRLFWRRKHFTDTEKIGFGLMIGIFSFAVAGLTNDTVVGSQNMYWILLGTGFAINRVIQKNREAVRIEAEREAARQREKEQEKQLRLKKKKR